MRDGTPYDPHPASLSEEAHPTPTPAPERIAHPTGRRSEAPAPTCTGRAAAEYHERLMALEAQSSIWCCTDEEAERRFEAEIGVRRPHATDCDCLSCTAIVGVHP